MTGFEHLLAPGRIGTMELPNRVVMAAMDMNLGEDGVIDEREVDHFAARARGGTALVTTGTSAISYPVGATTRKQPGVSEDRYIPGMRALADGVHEAGGRLCIQLCHHGKISAVDTADGRPMLVPSVPVPKFDLAPLIDTTPAELQGLMDASEGKSPTYRAATEEGLRWVIDQHADAAGRVQQAGADAVEVHAGHGYLLSTFLSAGYNRREDDWGGSIENRARLTCEVVGAIRSRVGPGYPVIVKLNGREFDLENALTDGEVVAASRLIEAAGADAIHVSGYSNDPFGGFTSGPLPAEVAAYRSVTSQVKRAVGIPVIAVGRVLPEVAEEMLAAGECDFVAMGRWLLTDPDLVAKIAAGNRASVRPCINCYVCVERNFVNQTPVCTVNAALQTPLQAEPPRAETPRQVVVVGGGPAGMEVARLAARRGHRVTLVERERHLGGTAWFSELTTPANGPFLRWQEHELAAEGVTIRTGAGATVESVRGLGPDVVVVATGARRERPPVPGAELAHVHSGDDLRAQVTGSGQAPLGSGLRARLAQLLTRVARRLGLLNDVRRIRLLSRIYLPIGRHVVVVGGGLVGLELAEFLAQRRRSVTVLEEGGVLGLPMAMPRRLAMVSALARQGVTVVRKSSVERIEPGQVTYLVGEGRHVVRADSVVLAAGVRPDHALAGELRSAGLEVRLVGDSDEVGYIFGAVHTAWKVAQEL